MTLPEETAESAPAPAAPSPWAFLVALTLQAAWLVFLLTMALRG